MPRPESSSAPEAALDTTSPRVPMTPLRREIGQKSTLEERIHLGFAGQRSTTIGLIDETPGHHIYRISAVVSRRQIRAPNLLPKSIFDRNRHSNMRAQLARDPIRASRCPIHDDPFLHGAPPALVHFHAPELAERYGIRAAEAATGSLRSQANGRQICLPFHVARCGMLDRDSPLRGNRCPPRAKLS